MDGEVAAVIIQGVAAANLVPGEVLKSRKLNVFRRSESESEMMREHKAKLDAMRIAAAAAENQKLRG